MGKFKKKKGITNDNDTQQISYINIEQKKRRRRKRENSPRDSDKKIDKSS